MKHRYARLGVSVLAAAVLAVPMVVATAEVVVPSTPRVGSLVQVGPIDQVNAFPTWYRDNDGAGNTSRLEQCLPIPPATVDPFCAAPVLPNPAAPMSYPDNYPNEIFYQMATANPLPTMKVEMNLEGAYSTGAVIPGDEMVFARIRIRDGSFADGTVLRIIHPYGIDEITATAKKGINSTVDVGLAPGVFTGALGGRIGPFLKWDPAVAPPAPAGYTGDPAVLHSVVGSPYGTNSVTVQEKQPNGTFSTIASTDQFLIQGRYATKSGVDINKAVYTQRATGTGTVDVFASSEVGQVINVSANPLGFPQTTMLTDNGRYFAHLPVIGTVPPDATVEVVNTTDNPDTSKTAAVVDQVTITSAVFTTGAPTDPGVNTLVVNAVSSDALTNPDLTVTGFGPLVAGTATFTTLAPPATITVTSARGGSATVPVTSIGAVTAPTLPVAAFTAPTTVSQGQPVVLDGAASTGTIATWSWTQTAGTSVPLANVGVSAVSFTPTAVGLYTFELVVSGPGGTSAPVSHSISVTVAGPLTVSAGPNQTVQRGTAVTLDASATTNQVSVTWTQITGPAVTLSSTTALKPTFTYPLMPLPAAAVGVANAGYVANNAALTFRVTALSTDGVTTDSADVVITPAPETISAVAARYRTAGGTWRVTGTTSISAGQRVAVVLGSLPTGQTIGTAVVGAGGAFSVRAGAVPDPRVAPAATQVTVVSETGAVASFTLNITT